MITLFAFSTSSFLLFVFLTYWELKKINDNIEQGKLPDIYASNQLEFLSNCAEGSAILAIICLIWLVA